MQGRPAVQAAEFTSADKTLMLLVADSPLAGMPLFRIEPVMGSREISTTAAQLQFPSQKAALDAGEIHAIQQYATISKSLPRAMPRPTPSTLTKKSADRGVKRVVLGDISFQTWYHSIYPEELVNKQTDVLCQASPPGTKIYEHGGYAVWEIDGEDQKLFAQNLSLFAKLFLDHKSVFFDVTSFLYYVLTFVDPKDPQNYYVLGYFSKEKLSWDPNNLACILIFPPYQHKQLGKLLMGVSYKLSAWEWEGGLIGGPERPLSEMGYRSYMRFWAERIARYFLLGPPGGDPDNFVQQKQMVAKAAKKRLPRERMTVREIGLATGMLAEDVITTLKEMGVVEPQPATKRQKKAPGTTSTGDSSGDNQEAVTIRKSNVLEWAKIHNVTLRDPVREDGFIGEWAPEYMQSQQDSSD
ncbi:Histone acetyltransferase KAT6B [Talaromyces islandicus]|uniref:histone acetyltransferase n=1 Tax=Talaromyces islandicus TaxID=28573 RepID=A0A0U1LQL4_TALIS|nr:Histone acetyltransferase KAT6B [Talaromyces islandicus]